MLDVNPSVFIWKMFTVTVKGPLQALFGVGRKHCTTVGSSLRLSPVALCALLNCLFL